MEIVPHPQHQSTNSHIQTQIPLETASLETTLARDAASLKGFKRGFSNFCNPLSGTNPVETDLD